MAHPTDPAAVSSALLSVHPSAVVSIACFDDETRGTVVVCCWSNGLLLWLDNGGPYRERRFDHPCVAMALSPSEDTLAVVYGRHLAGLAYVSILDAHTGAKRRVVPVDFLYHGLAYSPDGERLALCGDRGIDILDIESGTVERKVNSSMCTHAVAWSPNGKWIAADTSGYKAAIWCAETGALVLKTEEHPASIRCMQFSPNNCTLAVGTWGGDVCIWNTKNGACAMQFKGRVQPAGVTNLAWAPRCSTRVATATEDGCIRVWNTLSADCQLEIKHANARCVAWTPDGMHVVAGNGEGEVRMYSALTLNHCTDS